MAASLTRRVIGHGIGARARTAAARYPFHKPAAMPTDRAVTVSLLVTSAVKYAYPAGESGPIQVGLQDLGGGTV